MIEQVFEFIIEYMIKLVNLLLIPIDNLIKYMLPDISVVFSYIGSFFDWLAGLIPWAISYLGLNSEILSLISSYLVFRITISITFVAVKIAIKWYNALKP